MNPRIAIIMGSSSDYPIMQQAENIIAEFGVEVVKEVVSAHRTPEKMVAFAKTAQEKGISVIIAGAGGSAPSWNGCIIDNVASDWRSHQVE